MFEFVAKKLVNLLCCLHFSLPFLVKHELVNFNKQALEKQESSSVFRRLLGIIVGQIIVLERACLLLPGDMVFP